MKLLKRYNYLFNALKRIIMWKIKSMELLKSSFVRRGEEVMVVGGIYFFQCDEKCFLKLLWVFGCNKTLSYCDSLAWYIIQLTFNQTVKFNMKYRKLCLKRNEKLSVYDEMMLGTSCEDKKENCSCLALECWKVHFYPYYNFLTRCR